MPLGTLKVSVSAGGTCHDPPLFLRLDGAPQTVLGNLVPPDSPMAPKGDTRAVPAPALRKVCGFQPGDKGFAGAPVYGAGWPGHCCVAMDTVTLQ